MRGVYGRDSSPTGLDKIKSTGFNVVTSMPYKSELDKIAAKSMKAIVWLGEYHRGNPCDFEWDDGTVTRLIEGIQDHPAILAYQVSDEPDLAIPKCAPGEPAAETKQRADLIKRVAADGKPTYVVISAWNGQEGFPYQYFAGTTDIMGISVYPCTFWEDWVGNPSPGCFFGDINRAIAEAKADGVSRYWALIQLFEDNWYRYPKPWELKEQFNRWDASRMEGYVVYYWSAWAGSGGTGDVETKPKHLNALKNQNARTF